MKKLVYVAVAALLLLARFGITNAASCTSTGADFQVLNAVWGNSTQHVQAGPGDMGVPLTITMENYGENCPLNDVEGQLILPRGFTFSNSSEYQAYHTPQVSPCSTFTMVFYLNIAKNVSTSPNMLEQFYLGLSWFYQNNTVPTSQAFYVGVPMPGVASLSYTAGSAKLVPGLNNLTITLKNGGSGYAYDTVTRISAPSGLSVLNQPEEVGALAPGESKNLSVYLYAQSGTTGVPVDLSISSYYTNPYGYNTSADAQLGLYIEPAPQDIFIYPSNGTLVAGEVENESITVMNSGSSPIRNVSVLLSPQTPLDVLGKNGYVVFSYIPAGSSISFPVTLYSQPSSTSTVDTMDASLTYTLDNQTQTASRTLAFLTPGLVNLTQTSVTVLPSAPTIGSIFSITATLNNLGTTAASAVSVTAFPPHGIEPEGGNTTFMGDMAVDSPTAFTLSFLAQSGIKPGEHTIPIVVSYSNNLNQRVSETMDFAVNLSQGTYTVGSGSTHGSGFQGATGTAAQGAPPLGFIVVLILVTVVVIALLHRRRGRDGRVREK